MVPPPNIFLPLCLTPSGLSSYFLSHFLSSRCSIVTRKSSRGIRWRTGAKWSDRSTYPCCLRSRWPLILLEVDIYVGIAHGSIGEEVGEGRRMGRGRCESSRADAADDKAEEIILRCRGSRWWDSELGERERGLAVKLPVGSVFSSLPKKISWILTGKPRLKRIFSYCLLWKQTQLI